MIMEKRYGQEAMRFLLLVLKEVRLNATFETKNN